MWHLFITRQINKLIALLKYIIGVKYQTSTFIDEDTITMGYGKLDSIGEFQYPLPNKIIKHKMGTTSWNVWFKRMTQ